MSEADASLIQEIVSLLAKKTGLKVAELSLDARLLHDLGVDGDDARELILAFAHEFGVDISAFRFSKHFRSEPSLLNVLWFLPSHKEERIERKVPVTIRDLVEAARSKTWNL